MPQRASNYLKIDLSLNMFFNVTFGADLWQRQVREGIHDQTGLLSRLSCHLAFEDPGSSHSCYAHTWEQVDTPECYIT